MWDHKLTGKEESKDLKKKNCIKFFSEGIKVTVTVWSIRTNKKN